MPGTFNFTVDNVGGPDGYVVQTPCRRLRMAEKDRTVATLAPFNVYVGGAAQAYQLLGGEEFQLEKKSGFYAPGQTPFTAETVGIASRVFTVTEDSL